VSVNKDAIEAHYAAGDAGDLQGMLAPFAPDIIWTEAAGFPLAGTYVGPAAVAENVFGALQRDWDGYGVAIDELLESGDTIIGVGTYSGTYKATGKSFQARVVHLWRVKDGKAVRFEQVTDTAEVLAAMS
jgi:ketosteroid isomerase-like protein